MAKNRIRELRKERGLTQVELAKILGVTQNAIYKLETGESDLNTKWMEKLSSALNVKPYELLPIEWQPQPISKTWKSRFLPYSEKKNKPPLLLLQTKQISINPPKIKPANDN